MRLVRKNVLDLWIGIFWIISGAFTIQLAWFVISIPMESKELWFLVLEAIGKDATFHILMAMGMFVVGIFQALFGIFMAVTRDSKVDITMSKKDKTED